LQFKRKRDTEAKRARIKEQYEQYGHLADFAAGAIQSADL
jgi:hypothetical protein